MHYAEFAEDEVYHTIVEQLVLTQPDSSST